MALPSNQKASFGLNSMLGVLLFMLINSRERLRRK